MHKFTATLALLSVLPYLAQVKGHGYVTDVTVGGKKYPGWNFNNDPYYSDATRPVSYTRKNDGNGPCFE